MTVNPLVIDFIKTAQSNGITHLWAYLPFHHPLVKSNQVRQIRVLKDVLASGIDELGNRVMLLSNGTVQQWT